MVTTLTTFTLEGEKKQKFQLIIEEEAGFLGFGRKCKSAELLWDGARLKVVRLVAKGKLPSKGTLPILPNYIRPGNTLSYKRGKKILSVVLSKVTLTSKERQ